MTMYKGYELEAVSYENLNTGRWIPVVHITYPKGHEHHHAAVD